MKDFVRCKIERKVSENSLILTQPVIIRSFKEEFGMKSREYTTPAASGEVSMKGLEGQQLDSKNMQRY
jgi:hypothetical protein